MSSTSPTRLADRVVCAPGGRRALVLEFIRNAQSRLSLARFLCNEQEIFRELAVAVCRGLDVEVLGTSRTRGGTKTLHKLRDRFEAVSATVIESPATSPAFVAGGAPC
jgi:hypothetical protein